MSCGAPVDYWVEKGYGHHCLKYKCGNTGVDGEAVLCDECGAKVDAGTMARPGYCIHGVAISEYDCDCFQCEMGD